MLQPLLLIAVLIPSPLQNPVPATLSRPGYHFEILGGPHDAVSAAYDISESGLVVGTLRPPGSPTIATIWSSQGTQRLGLYGSMVSTAFAVNSTGTVVGGLSQGPLGFRSFRWRAGSLEVLTVNGIDQTGVWAMSESGEIVGYVQDNSPYRAAHWSASGQGRLIPLPASSYSIATGMNEPGAIVGVININDQERGFRFVNGTTTLLEPLVGHTFTILYDINNLGVAVGSSREYSSWTQGESRAVVMTDQGVRVIPLGDDSGEYLAGSINDRGQIIGHAGHDPFLYGDGSVWLLGQLANRHQWSYSHADGLNERGQIVGRGKMAGLPKGFVLMPCLANIDRDPQLDMDDFDLFYRAYQAGDEMADVDDNGIVDANDELVFLQAWNNGC